MKQTHCTDELQNKYETKTYPQIWLVKCSFFISPLFKITKTHFKQMTKKQEKRATERFLHANLWHKQNATFQICLRMELKSIHCINMHKCVCKCILFCSLCTLLLSFSFSLIQIFHFTFVSSNNCKPDCIGLCSAIIVGFDNKMHFHHVSSFLSALAKELNSCALDVK